MRSVAFVLSLSVLLAGCAGTAGTLNTGGLSATGDQNGGRIPNGMNDVPAAEHAATAHCAQFHKKAMLTVMQTQEQGGLVAFECH